MKTTCNVSVAVPPAWIEHKFSNYHFLLAVTAWCLRFIHKLKRQQPLDPNLPARHLTAQEIRAAEHLLVSMSQARSFAPDKQHLSSNQPISPSSKLRALNPFLDGEQLLRVGGRLSNSALSTSQRHPLILDSKDTLTILLYSHMHVCLGHCVPSLLLCSTGRRFHVLGARRLSRTVCSQCRVCRRVSARNQPQQLADYPAERVKENPSFTIVGVDYAGPFLMKQGYTRRPVIVKGYLAVFVCFCTRAIHLDVVSDLTTKAFLACLKSFISRRGCPATINSDNGSNFKGARKDLQDLYQFLKTTAPTSAVKSAKHHLKRIVGPQKLTNEEFQTVICQVEACLNSRPLLITTSHNLDGMPALTAGHCLIGRPLTAYPETLLPEKLSLLKSWNLCQALVQQFWDRWSREYLKELQGRSKWRLARDNLLPGDVVILKDDHTFSCYWPMAKVVETYPGKDGLVRVAKVKTSTSILKRPVTKLSLLHRDPQPPEPAAPAPGSMSSQGAGHCPSEQEEDQATVAAAGQQPT